MSLLNPVYRALSTACSNFQKTAAQFGTWLGRMINQLVNCSGSAAKTKDLAEKRFSENSGSSKKTNTDPSSKDDEKIAKQLEFAKKVAESGANVHFLKTHKEAEEMLKSKSSHPQHPLEAIFYEVASKDKYPNFFVGFFRDEQNKFAFEPVTPTGWDWTTSDWCGNIGNSAQKVSGLFPNFNEMLESVERKFV